MFEFDVDVGKKLDAPSKRKIYDMLVAKAQPSLLKAKDVCLLGLCNWRYGEWLRDEFLNIRKVTVIESKQLRFMYRDLESLEAYNIVYVEDNRYVEALEEQMKFDCIIQNPPYQRNLHLKILAEAIKHLKDDGTCVNLSPDNWITNPFKMFEKEKLKREAPKTIGKHIKDYESYSADDFNTMFGTSNYFGVGIVVIGTKETGFDCNKFNSTNTLLLKVLEKTYKLPSLRSKFSRRIDDSKFVPVRRRTHKTYNYCEMDSKDIDAKDGILFDTEEEALNFKKSIVDTWLYKWLDTTEWDGSENSAEAPFLGNAINPRTKLKGYKGEWTDDDLYKFFNITPEEQKVIEETMEKYKQ